MNTPPPQPPTPPPPRPPSRPSSPAEAIAAASASMRQQISAYPSSITYLDLIRRNKRESVALMAGLIVLGVLIGALIGGAIGPYFVGLGEVGRGFGGMYSVPSGSADEQLDHYAQRHEQSVQRFRSAPARAIGADTSLYRDLSVLLPSLLIGAGVALVLACTGAAWSWFGGAGAILSMAGARPVHPEEDPLLYNVVDEMRLAAGLPMPRVYIIEDSALNAFATGRDPEHAAVAVTRGLREKLTRDQLQGVVAHEMAHIRHFDIRFAMLMATMVGLIVFACDAFLRIGFRGAMMSGGRRGGGGGGRGKSGGGLAIVVIVLAVILAIVAPIFARFIQMSYSRRREYLADAGAVELTRNPQGLADALAILADDPDPLVDTANRGTAHLYIVNPLRAMARAHQALDTPFSSHPPIQKRIARLLALLR